MDKFLDKKEDSVFLPLTQIEDVIGAKLSCSCILLTKFETQTLARIIWTLSVLCLHIFRILFRLFQRNSVFIERPNFYSKVTEFLKWASKHLKKEIFLPPKEQICFHGTLKETECFNLHLANTVCSYRIFFSKILEILIVWSKQVMGLGGQVMGYSIEY